VPVEEEEDICIHLYFPYSIKTIKTNFMGFCLNVVPFELPVIGNTDITALEISMVGHYRHLI
jgi:hypothetical protein